MTEQVTGVDLVSDHRGHPRVPRSACRALPCRRRRSPQRLCAASAASRPKPGRRASPPTTASSRPIAPPAASACAWTAAPPTRAPSSPYYDSLLVKVTWGSSADAIARMDRSLREFRIRSRRHRPGLPREPDRASAVQERRVHDTLHRPDARAAQGRPKRDRATKLLEYLGGSASTATRDEGPHPAGAAAGRADRSPACDPEPAGAAGHA